eukprot:scaffold47213_cov270-Isochrysis_galbana.AAC.2
MNFLLSRSNQWRSLKQRPGAEPPKMSTRRPKSTAECAQRGHGRWPRGCTGEMRLKVSSLSTTHSHVDDAMS